MDITHSGEPTRRFHPSWRDSGHAGDTTGGWGCAHPGGQAASGDRLLATNKTALTLVLDRAYRTISGFLLRRAELTRTTGHTDAVTIVQRFRSALNPNVHFHLPFMDGVHLAMAPIRPSSALSTSAARTSRNRALATGSKGSNSVVRRPLAGE